MIKIAKSKDIENIIKNKMQKIDYLKKIFVSLLSEKDLDNLAVNESNGRLDPKDTLIRLGEIGITSLILEETSRVSITQKAVLEMTSEMNNVSVFMYKGF